MAVYVVIAIIFFLVIGFEYKGGPVEKDESVEEEGEEDFEVSIEDAKVKIVGTKDTESEYCAGF
ncbi:unnamed protein product [Dibothriocephalus latus]|uniref:Uncharacterized protein n=1 Tax=Dibothriocephalus latus TaxID=60516 RepID=A0A3P7QX53_DIBLA|nr:unnamed protein product [Dibothriocephalus latus]